MHVAQQEVVFEGSKSLCSATNSKAYFGNVTIVIPNDWVGEGENVDGMTWPRSFQADVVVTEEHTVFGAKPFTLQYGSCGMGGLPIQIPFGFFNETDDSKRGIN
jgi:Calcium-activated chloride channel N terminal